MAVHPLQIKQQLRMIVKEQQLMKYNCHLMDPPSHLMNGYQQLLIPFQQLMDRSYHLINLLQQMIV